MSENPIYKRIKALMDRDGITLRDLERDTKIPYSRSYEWNRRAASKPNGADAATLANYFHVPVGHIMNGDPIPCEDGRDVVLSIYDKLPPDRQASLEDYARYLRSSQGGEPREEGE